MTGQIILDTLMAVGASLALIGLGGAVSLLARRDRGGSLSKTQQGRVVQITIEHESGPPQVVTLPQDSTVVEQLNKVEGIHISVDDKTPVPPESPISDSSEVRRPVENRRFEIVGLVSAVAVTLTAVLPFVISGKVLVTSISAIGALVLTTVGIAAGRLNSAFTREEWKARSTKTQAEAIRDAALLRDLSSPSEDPDR
jgi:hypothetical protein